MDHPSPVTVPKPSAMPSLEPSAACLLTCDPQSSWQRGSNENTNALLRQYFPKGTDLSQHGIDELSAVAHALNTRPRKTLGWQTPAEALDRLLKQNIIKGVATTG